MSHPELPIYSIIPGLLEKLAKEPVTILHAPPGAGKSTILPIEILRSGILRDGNAIMLQPRRLAARSVAERISGLLNEKTGQTCGYRVRFDSRISPSTRIEVVTEGILTRILQQDNALTGKSLVIFDEFHERSIHSDLSLALLREAQSILRPDLKILIMSATLDLKELTSAFPAAPVISCEVKNYPVEIKYESNTIKNEDPIHKKSAAAIQKALAENKGDILAFLPGYSEISKTYELLSHLAPGIKIHMLYGDLPFNEQQQAILPSTEGKRKVILSTSIAETSLTIEGVKIVVDSGYSRVSRPDPATGLSRLMTIRSSMDTIIQRTGRAGRTGPGVCYRLWNKYQEHQFNEQSKPEILESDLAQLLLELYSWGVSDPYSLQWITPPPRAAISAARSLLTTIGAIENNRISEKGRAIANIPSHPRIGNMIIEAQKIKCEALACELAALLEGKDPDRSTGADITLRLDEIYRGINTRSYSQIIKIAAAYRSILKIKSSEQKPDIYDAGKLISIAYPERIARKAGSGLYKTITGKNARIDEHDPLNKHEFISIAFMDLKSSEGRIFMAAPLNKSDLIENSHERRIVRWDSQKKAITGTQETVFNNFILESKPLNNISPEERREAIIHMIKEHGIDVLPWTDEALQLLARSASLKKWEGINTGIDKETLLNTLNEWLRPYLNNIKTIEDLQKIDLRTMIEQGIPYDLKSKLDKLTPVKLKVPTGSMIDLKYSEDGSSPVLAVRLQEIFGMLETPTVCDGRIQVMIHLLSPAYRPVQVTKDLRGFWERTYKEVRKELRLKYPKHSWPEDPFTAEPVRGVKKKH